MHPDYTPPAPQRQVVTPYGGNPDVAPSGLNSPRHADVRRPIREEYEELGVAWEPDAHIGVLWQRPGESRVDTDGVEPLRVDLPVHGRGPEPASPPPSCNTGVDNSMGVDYVSLTRKHDCQGLTFCELLKTPRVEWEELPRGGHGYRRCRRYGNVRVYYDGGEGMGSYCQISGKACRELEAAGKIRDWQEFFIEALDVHFCECKRLDVFVDDRVGLLDIDELERKFEAGECATHTRDHERQTGKRRGKGGGKKGDTLRIGTRESDSHMRIYDKALELRPSGRKIDEWVVEHGHHVRVELELKGKRAQAAAQRLALTGFGMGFIPGLIRGFIDFKEADAGGHNRRRAPTYGPWLTLMQSEEKVTLEVGYVQRTHEKALYYFGKQYGPTLAVEFLRLGGDVDAVTDFVKGVALDGRARLASRHMRALLQMERSAA